jgi:hypothetical protein
MRSSEDGEVNGVLFFITSISCGENMLCTE